MLKDCPLWLSVIALVSGCGGETDRDRTTSLPIGDACHLRDELTPSMAGYAESELTIDTPREDGTACLVDHFRGRQTCAYGQTEADLILPADHPNRCRTQQGEPVSVSIASQLSLRPPSDAIYTSCRCAGPDPDATYCTCPSGFHCAELSPPDLGSSDVAGSWCQRTSTAFDPTRDYGPVCTRGTATGEPGYCG